VENSSTGSDWKRVFAQSGTDYISYRRRAARKKYLGLIVKKKNSQAASYFRNSMIDLARKAVLFNHASAPKPSIAPNFLICVCSSIVCWSKIVPLLVPRCLVSCPNVALKLTSCTSVGKECVSASAPLSSEISGGINLCEASIFFLQLFL
jgi:hypothetical protein